MGNISTNKNKVLVFGIDGLPPDLIFKKYKKYLPNFSKLMKNGAYSRLNSTVPPTSIVAWTSLASGVDPSITGIHSYTSKPKPGALAELTNSTKIKTPLLWDILSKNKKKCIVLNIPLTYPTKKINGLMISDFLTPGFDDKSIYPIKLKNKIKKIIGKDYIFDVSGFTGYKKLELDELIKRIYEMTEVHFKVAEHLLKNEDWDLFFMVTIGSDRLHHMFWKYMDNSHKNFQPNSRYKNTILNFYKYLDDKLGQWLKEVGNNTTVVVVSDHGMDKMDNRINLNDWLIKNGYLKIKERSKILYANAPKKLNNLDIDWDKTLAIASGGYQGRIYFNKKAGNQKIIDGLVAKLKKIKGPKGETLENKVFETSKIYKKKDLEAPEIVVYFDNLRYGVNNDVGNIGLYSMGTTVGIDDAGHSPEGSLIIKSPFLKNKNIDLGLVDILQITPTILKILGIKKPKNMPGKEIT